MASTATDANERDVVGTSTVGEGPKTLVDRAKTLRFVFHNFEEMEEGRDKHVSPPPLEAFGYLWGLEFYPKGHTDSDTDIEYISVLLMYAGDDKYTPSAEFTFRCKENVQPFATSLFHKNQIWGEYDYLNRKDVLDNYLEEDGSLIIEVDIRITVDSKRVWYPKTIPTETSLKESYTETLSSSNNKTKEEFENDSTDVVVVVDNGRLFSVHKFVLNSKKLLKSKIKNLCDNQFVVWCLMG